MGNGNEDVNNEIIQDHPRDNSQLSNTSQMTSTFRKKNAPIRKNAKKAPILHDVMNN